MSSLKHVLKRNIPDSRLKEMYQDEDYYWYLKSDEFQRAFLQPLGNFAKTLGDSVLDVGCGEGWLWPHVKPMRYLGIDASEDAIRTAEKTHEQKTTAPPNPDWLHCRFEDYTKDKRPWFMEFDVVVFGGILDVLVREEHRRELIDHYIKETNCKHIIIYDLQRLNASFMDGFHLEAEVHNTVDMTDIVWVKRHRKILIYKVAA